MRKNNMNDKKPIYLLIETENGSVSIQCKTYGEITELAFYFGRDKHMVMSNKLHMADYYVTYDYFVTNILEGKCD